MANYTEISSVPQNISFLAFGRDQGQIVETEHSEQVIWRQTPQGIRQIPLYRRTTDRSTGRVTLERLVGQDVEVELRCAAFSGEGPRVHRLVVDDVTGDTRVYDSTAGHYTTCHSLSDSAIRRARKEASPVAL